MRTAVLYGKEDIRIEDRPVPEPGPGQMLVKIDYVGICGTDIEFYKLGQTPTPLPKILGHENSGTYRQKKRSCSRLWCRLFSEFRHGTGHRRIHP